MTEHLRFSLEEATGFAAGLFEHHGLEGGAAHSVARALIGAEAEGQAGHGLSRIPAYLAQFRAGKINRSAQIKLSKPRPSGLFVDADGGFAFPALDAAFEAALPMAHEQGVVAISLHRSHHCGSLGYQVERYGREGLIALMVANAPKAMAAWGGKQALFGTNPIAFTTPVDGHLPIVIDLSLSRVARGKVMLAAKEGRSIPEGWALDADGQPTTDPNIALQGTMAPIGDAKGTALALMVEVLAAGLTGSNFSHEASSFFDAEGPPPHVGQFLLVIDPQVGQPGMATRLAGLVEIMLSEPDVRLPGARRQAAVKRAREEGITVPAKLFAELQALARDPT